MASSVIGSVAGGAVSGIMGGKSAGRQADATVAAASLADPFRSQRGYYQSLLGSIYGMPAGYGAAPAPQGPGSKNLFKQGLGGKKNAFDWLAPGGGAVNALLGGGSNYSALGSYVAGRPVTNAGAGPGGFLNKNYNPYSDITGGGAGGGADLSGYYSTQGGGGAGVPGMASNPIEAFIQNSPDYQFRFKEGQRALERSASAKGNTMSGGLLRDLVTFGQGSAASAFESEINRIMTMAGATVGSPGVAGQLAAQGAAIRNQGQQQLMGGIGYGISQLANNWGGGGGGSPTGVTANNMIAGQTGYQGGAAGVLSGDEWANF